jgi:hypothetical protein
VFTSVEKCWLKNCEFYLLLLIARRLVLGVTGAVMGVDGGFCMVQNNPEPLRIGLNMGGGVYGGGVLPLCSPVNTLGDRNLL